MLNNCNLQAVIYFGNARWYCNLSCLLVRSFVRSGAGSRRAAGGRASLRAGGALIAPGGVCALRAHFFDLRA